MSISRLLGTGAAGRTRVGNAGRQAGAMYIDIALSSKTTVEAFTSAIT